MQSLQYPFFLGLSKGEIMEKVNTLKVEVPGCMWAKREEELMDITSHQTVRPRL